MTLISPPSAPQDKLPILQPSQSPPTLAKLRLGARVLNRPKGMEKLAPVSQTPFLGGASAGDTFFIPREK